MEQSTEVQARRKSQWAGHRTWTILGNYAADHGSFNAVDDVVARSRDKVSIFAYLYVLLERDELQHQGSFALGRGQ